MIRDTGSFTASIAVEPDNLETSFKIRLFLLLFRFLN